MKLRQDNDQDDNSDDDEDDEEEDEDEAEDDEEEAEEEDEYESEYIRAGTNFYAFNYGFKGDILLSKNFTRCGISRLQNKYLEIPAYKVKSRYAKTNKEHIFNATMAI